MARKKLEYEIIVPLSTLKAMSAVTSFYGAAVYYKW
jgi:hypothetical protein